MANKDNFKIIPFSTQLKFEQWLEKNHLKSPGIWLRIFKKASGKKSVDYAEALDVALCYGWIDGQKKSLDEVSWIQRFTHRRAKSDWSRRNTEHVARLLKAKRIKANGLKQIEEAKKDGRWGRAYDPPASMTIPADFIKLVNKNPQAKAFFGTLSKSNRYAIGYRLQTAKKAETREKRVKDILAMLSRGEAYHVFKKPKTTHKKA